MHSHAGIIALRLPSPPNFSVWWNFGSLLGLCLVSQILRGLLLAAFYVPDTSWAFVSVIHLSRDVRFGWALRGLHVNMASLYFFCLYAHIGRGIYYGSHRFPSVWVSGLCLLLLSMITAFVGYVLP